MKLDAVRRFVSLADVFTEYTGKLIAWLTVVVVVLTFAIVLLRYGFNLGWIAMQEMVLYAHGAVFMLGAAFTLKHDAHVRVDIFYQQFSIKQKAWVNLLGTVFLLLPVCLFVFYVSIDYVLLSWQLLESSKEPGGLPAVYLNKTLIWLLVLTLTLQGLAEIGRNWLIICDQNANGADHQGDADRHNNSAANKELL
ncbi:TRAP transporter small permease subunit [Thalassotalea sp. HSM 43]|uniref:TRAP transporter small permease subunit n=1 Tax=Thalassotalea sp. HSM 43 TaxID=2552945 RepID=UPI0010800E8B|nr:TRAP transporter small permease subunit [Thalassotalea sp. HSM 43]QBY05119.1 TRAP transporter small permease subunit [Thalassotalea sp. HSM 43]